MTVKQLKEKLNTIPEEYEIYFMIRTWDPEFDWATDDTGIVKNVKICVPNEPRYNEFVSEQGIRPIAMIEGDSFRYRDDD